MTEGMLLSIPGQVSSRWKQTNCLPLQDVVENEYLVHTNDFPHTDIQPGWDDLLWFRILGRAFDSWLWG